MPRVLTEAVLEKILEQIDRIEHLVGALPEDSLDWTLPVDRPWPTGRLLAHLADCLEGFCAVLHTACPGKLSHFAELRSAPPLSIRDLASIRARIRRLTAAINEGFEQLEDAALSKRYPTVFDPSGQTVLGLLLGNLEHLVNHKHQLFTYLRCMKVDVRSPDLYCFRGPKASS